MATTPSVSGAPAPRAPETVWTRRPSVDLATLDDARLTDYRHPDEWRTLLATVGVLAALVLILVWLGPDLRATLEELLLQQSLGFMPRALLGSVSSVLQPGWFASLLAMFLLVTAGVQLVSDWLRRAEILAEAAELTKTTFPQHYAVLDELRRRFAMSATRVFVYRAPAGPYSFGIREPYVIVFPSPLLDQMTIEEFKFALGRELGHIKLGHTRVRPLLGAADLPAGGVASWLARLRNVLTASYLRAQELSCDRIGVLATRSIRPAVDRAINQSIFAPRGTKVDLLDLTEQAGELTRGPTGLALRIQQFGHSQPALVCRLLALTEWAGLPPPEPATPTTPAAAAAGSPNPTPAAPRPGAAATPLATKVDPKAGDGSPGSPSAGQQRPESGQS